MTFEDVRMLKAGPEMDALVHLHFGDGSEPAPAYSTSYDEISRLASKHDFGLAGQAIGLRGRRLTMDLYRHGQYLRIGASTATHEPLDPEARATALAALAARSMLKWVIVQGQRSDTHPHPDLGQPSDSEATCA